MKPNQIYQIHGTDYKTMTKQLLAEAGLYERLPSADCRIGIKPNLLAPTPASHGATTHPEIVAGIIEYLQERNCRNILIAEGSWVGARTSDTLKVCGYDRLAEQYGVDLCDTQKDSFHSADCAGMQLNICDCVSEIDFLINVPVLKGHCQTKITCALKNMKGLIPNSEKRRFHTLGLHKPIAHLSVGIRQDFIVVDHICGDLDFEEGGKPVVRNCIMAACDPVLVDSYVCQLLHYRVQEVPYVAMAAQLGAGSADLSFAEIIECGESQPGKETLPSRRRIAELQHAVMEENACSACYGNLIPALDRLRQEGLLEKLEDRVCIGQGFRNRQGKLGAGRCTKQFQHHLDGCPPTEQQIYEFLKGYLRA